MSVFNDMLPLHLFDLEKRLDRLGWEITEKNRALNYGPHQCDCEFCDYDDPFDAANEDELQREIDKLEQERELVEDTVRRLKQYAKDKGIELKGKKVRA